MSISTAKAGTKVTLAPDTKNRILFDVYTCSYPDITPGNIFTIKQTIPCKGETYPAFLFEETDRCINGLFLDYVE